MSRAVTAAMESEIYLNTPEIRERRDFSGGRRVNPL